MSLTNTTTRACQVKDLGLIEYDEAYTLQKKYAQEVIGLGKEMILLCEHTPVLTLGRLTKAHNILYSKDEIEDKGVKIREIDRGGDVTLHAPGQLVIYPILNLAHYGKDLHAYLNALEQVAIDLLSSFNISAERFPQRTGVWVGGRKIVSIGIGVRKWISFHGIAINVNTDLSLFSLIKPCGFDVTMTSIAEIQRKSINMKEVKKGIVDCFSKNFQFDIE